MRFLYSIQARIVVGSVLIAGLVVFVLGVVVNDVLRQVAGASVVAVAKEELVPFATDLHDRPTENLEPPGPDRMILVVGPGGAPVINTLPVGLAPSVIRSRGEVNRLHAGGVSYVAVETTVVNARGTWHVWALHDTVSADLALQRLAQTLQLFIPVILLLVAVGSWLLVRAALGPVRRLRTAAERIRRSGVEQRLPEGRGRDELTALAVTLNGFLHAQRAAVERERRQVTEASHELRTPIAVLMTHLELAQEHSGNTAALEAAVSAALAQVKALSRVATQLLELAQLDADTSDTARGSSTVEAAISEVMACVDRTRIVASNGVQIDFELLGTLVEARQIRMTAVAFRRIVDNLTINAVHATTRGTIAVALEQTAVTLTLTVADTGTGIPIEFLPRVFERFTRSEQSRASGADGSGLGLALVYGLAHTAGGRVQLENRATGGAVATVEIPLLEGP